MEKTDWKVKAEKFLESHLNDDNHNAEEAAVYFLSRRKTNKIISNIVDDTIKRWKEDKTKWSVGCRVNPTGVASMLKLMQWGEIGVLRKYRDTICQDFGVPYSHDFYPDDQGCGGHFSKTAAFFPLIFPIFTSDIAINQMGTKLIFLLHQWQNHLNDLLMRKRLFIHSIDDDQEGNIGQVFATLISAYIFAAYRLGKVGINQDILDKSIQYLLDSQDDSGLWAYDKTAPDSEDDDISGYSLGDFLNSRKHVILAAVGIHAIFLANPIGAKRSIEKAAKWLLQHQHADGGWYQHCNPKYRYQVYTTVLVLDALEMAKASNKLLTFTPNMQLDYVDLAEGKPTTIGNIQKDMEHISHNQQFSVEKALDKLALMQVSSFASTKQLAEAFELPVDRVRSKLCMENKKTHLNDTDFRREIEDAEKNETKYLYSVEAVRPILSKMKRTLIKKQTTKKHP